MSFTTEADVLEAAVLFAGGFPAFKLAIAELLYAAIVCAFTCLVRLDELRSVFISSTEEKTNYVFFCDGGIGLHSGPTVFQLSSCVP